MVQKIYVEGYDAFKDAISKQEGKTVYVQFSGSVGADGKSWCPDCTRGKDARFHCLILLV